MALKITSKSKVEPWIDIELWQFTQVNIDSHNGHTAEVRLTEEQAKEIANYMNQTVLTYNCTR